MQEGKVPGMLRKIPTGREGSAGQGCLWANTLIYRVRPTCSERYGVEKSRKCCLCYLGWLYVPVQLLCGHTRSQPLPLLAHLGRCLQEALRVGSPYRPLHTFRLPKVGHCQRRYTLFIKQAPKLSFYLHA